MNPFTSLWKAGLLHGGRTLSNAAKASIISELFDEITALSGLDRMTLRYLFWGNKDIDKVRKTMTAVGLDVFVLPGTFLLSKRVLERRVR